MPLPEYSQALNPNLILVVRWSDRVADFMAQWQHRLAQWPPQHDLFNDDPDHWLKAALTVEAGFEQRQEQTELFLADLYRISGQLPTLGDELFVGPLVMRVDERSFETTYQGGTPSVKVTFCIGIERYRYGSSLAQDDLLMTSSAIIAK